MAKDETQEASALEPEIMLPSAVGEQTRAEIDVQIATAKQYPRQISKVREEIQELATLNQDTAESCWYALPRGGKVIEGPSIRFAEIVASAYGNIRAATRVIAIDDEHITCQGVCHDLEKNVAISTEVKRRIKDRNGRRYNEDMIVTTANAGSSIALRNAVLKVVPGALLKDVMAEVRKVGMGDARTLAQRRLAAFEYFKGQGVSKEKVLGVIGKRDVDDVTLEDLAVLRGLMTAINEGTTTIGEAFSGAAGTNGNPLDQGTHDIPKGRASAPPDGAASGASTWTTDAGNQACRIAEVPESCWPVHSRSCSWVR